VRYRRWVVVGDDRYPTIGIASISGLLTIILIIYLDGYRIRS